MNNRPDMEPDGENTADRVTKTAVTTPPPIAAGAVHKDAEERTP
jgi:hypothetical protein